ncbi:MAG: hypothetical protein U1F33_00025 [Alphaproteobacteria bacterium]
MDSTKLLEGLLGLIADYLNFVLRFPQSPRKTLEPYSASRKVEKDLTALFLAGIGASYLLILVMKPAEFEHDPSAIVAWFREVDLRALPPAILGITVAFAVVLHGLVRLYEQLTRLAALRSGAVTESRLLCGSLEDSVNAALAFGAFFAPASILGVTLAFWCSDKLAVLAPRWLMVPVGVFSLAWAAFLCVYFPWTLAAVHGRTTFWQAVRACWVGAVLILLPFFLIGG